MILTNAALAVRVGCISVGIDNTNLYVNSIAELELLLLANGVAEADIQSTWDSIRVTLGYANAAAAETAILTTGILKQDIIDALPGPELFRADFEDGLQPAGLTASGSGTITYNDTGTGVVGTYCMNINADFAAELQARISLGSSLDSFSSYFRMRWNADSGIGLQALLRVFDSSFNTLASMLYGGSSQAKATHGTIQTADVGGTAGNEYHYWVTYEKATSGDGKFRVYRSLDGIKGTPLWDITTGTSTAQAAYLALCSTGRSHEPIRYDNVLIVDGFDQLGDNPF